MAGLEDRGYRLEDRGYRPGGRKVYRVPKFLLNSSLNVVISPRRLPLPTRAQNEEGYSSRK
jgi:hypothetical protein